MNRIQPIARSITAGLSAIAATAALVMLVNAGATPDQPLMVLERVVIVGKSAALPQSEPQQVAQIQRLPRVVLEGRRNQAGEALQLAQLGCAQTAIC